MAGPSSRQVEGEEKDADVSVIGGDKRSRMAGSLSSIEPRTRKLTNNQWLKLVKTNHDVTVQVSDKVRLEGLPHECGLLAVSNRFNVLVVGGNSGECCSDGNPLIHTLLIRKD